jgi:hypothetical protein
LLKNAGVSDAAARDIIGHESEAVSRNYTHIDVLALVQPAFVIATTYEG